MIVAVVADVVVAVAGCCRRLLSLSFSLWLASLLVGAAVVLSVVIVVVVDAVVVVAVGETLKKHKKNKRDSKNTKTHQKTIETLKKKQSII